MTNTNPANQNQIQNSFFPLLQMWGRSIGWTILLSTLLAILLALVIDGCPSLR